MFASYLRCAFAPCLLFVFFLLAPARLLAQPVVGPSLDPAKALSQYHLDAWTTEDGLPQNQVGHILQTPDGYLWLSTREGLVQFDGTTFTRFEAPNAPALDWDEAYAMLLDHQAALWVGLNHQGLIRVVGDSTTLFNTARGLPSDRVLALAEDGDDRLYVGTHAGLARFEGDRFVAFTEADGLPAHQVSALTPTPEGGLLVGTDAGLFHYHDDQFTALPSPPGDLIWRLLIDAEGAYWVATDAGLFRYRDGQRTDFTAADGLVGTYVTALLQDRAGTIWVGTEENGTLHRYNGTRFEAFQPTTGAGIPGILSTFEDREGSLWIGTRMDGVFRLSDLKFTNYGLPEGLASDMAWTVIEDTEGAIWMGTKDGLSRRAPDGVLTTFTTADGLPHNYIGALAQRAEGGVWIGTRGGLAQYHQGRIQAYRPADGFPKSHITSLLEDQQGALWIGHQHGLQRYHQGQLITLTTDDGLPKDHIRTLHEAADGTLYIGTEGGLATLHGDSVTVRTINDGLTHNFIMAFGEDDDGAFWFSAWVGGVHRLQDGQLTVFGTQHGLPSDKIFAFLDDGQGGLWMSSNLGIFRVEKDDFEAVAQGQRTQVRYEAFDHADGLRSRESNGGTQPAGWRTTDGTLWFPTARGFAAVNPKTLRTNPVPPPIYLTDLRVDGVSHEAAAPRLPHGSPNLEFHYSGLSLLVPDRVTYQYRLDGVDPDWVDAGTRRAAFYTQVPPGTRTFSVRARNADGIWGEAAHTTLYITPFYRTPTFLLGLILLLGLGVAGVMAMRMYRLKARQDELEALVAVRTHALRTEKEKTEEALHEVQTAKEVIEAQATQLREMDRLKTQFFNNVSHEFRTPLTLTIGPLENVLGGLYGDVAPPVRRQLEVMLHNARRLLGLINQLLDLSKVESGRMDLQARPRNLASFLEGVVYSFIAFAESREIELTFTSTPAALEVYYDPAKLEKVFYNLLSNALKFTPAHGRITVTMVEADGEVCVHVADTGSGIDAADLPYIFDRFRQVAHVPADVQQGTGIGLALAKELVVLHGGQITAESTVGEGSTFTVTLPLGATHLAPHQLVSQGADELPESLTEALRPVLGRTTELLDAEAPARASHDHGDEVATILVVDDNRDIREYVTECLAHHYRVVTAQDGQDAVDQLATFTPDLVISDVMMPCMNGYDLCRHIKATPGLQTLPVILLTAKASTDMKVAGLELGADDYMAKPFKAQELLARIRNLLQLKAQEKALKVLNKQLEGEVTQQLAQSLQERERYEQDLINERDKAEASERLKSAILANVSHEFRTPMTAILGYTQLLSLDVEGEQKEFVDHISANGLRLMNTLNTVVDLARLQARDITVRREPLTLADVARDALAMHETSARRKGLSLRLEADTAVTAFADQHALVRILDVLLSNAVKFTEAGEVTVAVDRHEEGCTIAVQDTGCGIRPDFLPHLFEAFRQEGDGLTRIYEGSGLGLTVAQHFAQLMDGIITVESAQNEGSTFTISLPLRSEPLEPTSGDGRPGSPPQLPSDTLH